MQTKTRPLARFGYLAFALSAIAAFLRNHRPIGHTHRTASDLDLKSAAQV
ncbi:hypothetical protein ACK39D_08615 [Aeromonas veronii]